MTNLIMGTAGHIDHGKSTLIKYLTGIEMDRLEAEKERGISIELGFASLELGNYSIGIIDVPGHQKFIKNMVAGVSGIDFVLLVVAADDSVMPQTKEHLDIISLLGIENGIVVINKKDLVDLETIEIVELDIEELIENSSLKEPKVIPISAITGDGIKELLQEIEILSKKIQTKKSNGVFKMSVDRTFSVKGFGTVVTGTVSSGELNKNDELIILPKELKTIVRGIQIHGKESNSVSVGQRAAINLNSTSVEEIPRGSVICSPGYYNSTDIIDVNIRILESANIPKNGSELKFYIGTSERIARFYPIGNWYKESKKEGTAQIRFKEKITTVKSEKFIIRSSANNTTIGGGEILDAHALVHKRTKEKNEENIKKLISAEIKDVVLYEHNKADRLLSLEELKIALSLKEEEIDRRIKRLSSKDKLKRLKDGVASLSSKFFEKYHCFLLKKVELFHSENPLISEGLPITEIKQISKIFFKNELSSKKIDALILASLSTGKFKQIKNTLAISSRLVMNSPEIQKTKEEIMAYIISKDFMPPKKDELLSKFKENTEQLLNVLIKDCNIKIIEGFYYSVKILEKGVENLQNHLINEKESNISELKEVFGGISRKYIIPLLNYYESNSILKRNGDLRSLKD